jgi:hypothetical protein
MPQHSLTALNRPSKSQRFHIAMAVMGTERCSSSISPCGHRGTGAHAQNASNLLKMHRPCSASDAARSAQGADGKNHRTTDAESIVLLHAAADRIATLGTADRERAILGARKIGLSLAATVLAIGCLTGVARQASGQKPASKASATVPRYAVRGIYDRDLSKTGFSDEAAIGFDYIDSGPYPGEIQALVTDHLKGLVWLGGYDQTSCQFNESDSWVRSHVSAIAGSQGVGAYYIDDEPNAVTCPTEPSQIRARSALVKSIDPQPPTLLVTYRVDQLRLFAGTVDVIGLDHYPCSLEHGCDYSVIDQEAAAADQLGIRYWGVIQAAGDDYYKLPTPQELHEEFVHWEATTMQGYLVFAWHWPPYRPSLWLAHHPELLTQLAHENAS